MLTFDNKHIFVGHTTFLGCSFQLEGKLRYFKFTVLPFGLATGPYVFTKIERTLVKHWRSRGFTYRAIRYVLESYSYDLRGKEVCHKTDNRNAEIIMSVGS